jgi:phage baseplate assembly protein W
VVDVPNGSRAFLGEGWAYPLSIAPNNHLARAVYEEDVRQAILIILGTNPGERIMRPDFGAGLNDFLFEPISTTTLSLIRNRVNTALLDWEHRIDLERVRVSYDPVEKTKVLIEIHYRVRSTNRLFNLVYPFYLEEGNAR